MMLKSSRMMTRLIGKRKSRPEGREADAEVLKEHSRVADNCNNKGSSHLAYEAGV